MEQTVASMPTLPLMVQVPKAVVKCGTPESNLDFQDTNQLIIDFSSMHMSEVYAIQNVVNAKIRLQECHLTTYLKVTHQDLRILKSEIQEVEQRKLEVDGNYQRISEGVTFPCSILEEEGITPERDQDAKIAQSVELVMELKKNVVQLKEKRTLNTSLEVSKKDKMQPQRLQMKLKMPNAHVPRQ